MRGQPSRRRTERTSSSSWLLLLLASIAACPCALRRLTSALLTLIRLADINHSQPSTPTQSINPTPAFSRVSFVPQPNLPARIFLLRLLSADDGL
jgi:hypothetical protein